MIMIIHKKEILMMDTNKAFISFIKLTMVDIAKALISFIKKAPFRSAYVVLHLAYHFITHSMQV